ncbi:hypothetical protein OH77DRAFT_1415529, partial [Trametes cingulata]
GASLDDMRTSDLLDSFARAPSLSFDDILLSEEENMDLTHRLEHTILRIAVSFGGDRFARFRDAVDACLPVTEDRIPVHKTDIYPLPAMNIDESSTAGNADVLTEIYKNLRLDTSSPEFTKYVKIVCGDQLSVSRIRSLVHNRAGHESLGGSFLWALCMPGLFHYKMAATHGVLEMHFGSQNPRNPGSLAVHNAKLDRKPIILTSLPPFRTTRDLIFVSLYARVLHCMLLVSGKEDLDDYAATVSFPELQAHAKAVVARYANAQAVQNLREEREDEQEGKDTQRHEQGEPEEDSSAGGEEQKSQAGDMVFENACLFMRDALVLREFTDAIKSGDSGRVVTVLKLWTLGFRGRGRAKYAYKMLHMIHNLTHVWPLPLRYIVLQNWLVNPSGKADAWVEVDLMQEHVNCWIKTIYKAHGSNASWEWLGMIAPCVDILRRLATQINAELGGRQGVKHTSPDLERDIQIPIECPEENRVYTVEPGRVVDDGPKACVPNAVGLGWTQLAGPLLEFNAQLKRLQRRCFMTPLLGSAYTSARPTGPTEQSISRPSLAQPATTALSPRHTGPTAGERDNDSTVPVVSDSTALVDAVTLGTDVQEDGEDESSYWDLYDDFLGLDVDPDDDSRVPFTLDTAGDVSLDMDDLCTLE